MTWKEAAFQTLLLLLDRNPERAPDRLKDIFARLTRFLHRNLDADEAHDVAVETMFRLAAAIYRRLTGTDEGPGDIFEIPKALENENVYRRDSEGVMRLALGIAYRLRIDHFRRRRMEIPEDGLAEMPASVGGGDEG